MKWSQNVSAETWIKHRKRDGWKRSPSSTQYFMVVDGAPLGCFEQGLIEGCEHLHTPGVTTLHPFEEGTQPVGLFTEERQANMVARKIRATYRAYANELKDHPDLFKYHTDRKNSVRVIPCAVIEPFQEVKRK